MSVLQKTADCVRKHREKLREVYNLYSIGSSNLPKQNYTSSITSKHNEVWFLACKLVGVPTEVCGICIVENYRNGESLTFRSKDHASTEIYREFKYLRNILYGKHKWANIDISPYAEELTDEFDLRKTGQLGIVIIDLFDKEVLSTIKIDNMSSTVTDCSNELITNRNLVFTISFTDNIIYDFDTGSWNERRHIGPHEAQQKHMYSGLRRAAIDPYKNSVTFSHKNTLRSIISE